MPVSASRRGGVALAGRFVERTGVMPSALGRTMKRFRGSENAEEVAVAAGLTQWIAARRPDLLPFAAGERETAYLFTVARNLNSGLMPQAAVGAKREVGSLSGRHLVVDLPPPKPELTS